MRRVLITGMSATGKSTLVAALRSAGLLAFDADDGWVQVRSDGTQLWKIDAIRDLLTTHADEIVVFAGCEENMGEVTHHFDDIILLTVPRDVLIHRLATRSTNDFGKSEQQRTQILTDLDDVEPRLRTIATHVIDTDRPLREVVNEVLQICSGAR